MRVEFGAYSFDSARCLLSRGGAGLPLTRKAFLLLEMLLRSRPAVVSKQQIMDTLWPDCFVSEGSVASLVSDIRAVLGKEGAACIRTVHGVGYSFCADVTLAPEALLPAGARCVLIEKGPPPRSIELASGPTLIGRGMSCDVRVASGTVSRRHARLRLDQEVATLEDLGSRNGTYVRGGRVTRPTRVASGDAIRIGAVEMIFRIETAAEGETEPVD
jgi:DNA-binding winged helix-turn-helix (wHTH) protein